MLSKLQEFEIIPLNILWEEPENLVRLIKVMDEEDEERYWRYTECPLDLKKIYFPVPQRGGGHLPKFAIWQPGNMPFGSVLIPNYRDGMIQLMRHLNQRRHVRYFSTYLSKDHIREGICSFEHGAEDGARRTVQVILDHGWEFYSEGEFLPFENKEYYQRQEIANRLTPSIVTEYLRSLGWNLEDEAFWKCNGNAWVIDKTKFK